MDHTTMESPIGTIRISGDRDGITEVTFVDEVVSDEGRTSETLAEVVTQLKEYFSGKRTHFDLKLNPNGTKFQKKVWKSLQNVKFGKTRTYQEMANELGDSKVILASASANGKNPIAIIIPCHRIIGSDGSLTGYAGGLHRKKWLLEHENPVKQGTLF